MSDRAAWHCPNCGKTHAPHVDNCPEPVSVKFDQFQVGTPLYVGPMHRTEWKRIYTAFPAPAWWQSGR